MGEYVASKTEADGWVLISYQKTQAAFYYTKPLSKLDSWLKRPPRPTVIVEAEIDDDGVIHQRVVERSSFN
jgi:hypothetical protein